MLFKGYFHSDNSFTIYPESENDRLGFICGAAGLLLVLIDFLNFLTTFAPYFVLIYLAKKIKPMGRGAMILSVGTLVYQLLCFLVYLAVVFSAKGITLSILVQVVGICFAVYSFSTSVKYENKARYLEVTANNPQNHRSDLCTRSKKISLASIATAVIGLIAMACAAA